MSNDKNDAGSSISMEEIDRRIDEMPVFDLRDPNTRKKTNIDIDDIVGSLNFEAILPNDDNVKNIDKDDE